MSFWALVSRFVWVLSLVLFSAPLLAEDQIPQVAYQYRRALHAEVNRMWGLNLPTDAYGVSASTIQQESAWNPRAQSPYAQGLTQFTPGTWADIARRDPSIAALGDIWNPHAAIRAMVTYHHLLWGQLEPATETSERWAFVLSAYNGGLGWIYRDQKLCAGKLDCIPRRWWDNTERYSTRAQWAFRENRGYPRNILKRWLPLYRSF